MESTRQKKVSKLIQKEVSDIFQREFKVLAGVLITVNQVRISPDLSVANFYISVLPTEKRKEVVEILQENDWNVRKKLAGRIKNQVRIIPVLRFFEDDTQDHAEKMERLFDSIKEPENHDNSEE